MRRLVALVLSFGTFPGLLSAQELPVRVGSFSQQVHVPFTEGLPSPDVDAIALDDDGSVVVNTASGMAKFQDGAFHAVTVPDDMHRLQLVFAQKAYLELPDNMQNMAGKVFYSAHNKDRFAIAAANGLLESQAGKPYEMVYPREGDIGWAPRNVRVVAYDNDGRLWFGSPQGVGYRIADGEWKLFTGADGLPFNDFTSIAAGPDSIWFGTTNGAIRYHDGQWNFRQGRRWLLDNDVRDIAVDNDGNAWIATAAGVSCIQSQTMTLAEKAAYFEDELDTHHRRTSFGYVDPAKMTVPGDKSTAKPRHTDNDGHFTSLYLAAASLGYAATGDTELRAKATAAFEAVAFLSEVTQGGTHPAPPGYIARTILPTDGPNPNEIYSQDHDRDRRSRDKMWRIMDLRWPTDETGQWYWLSDSSTDELDAQFFGFGVYYDRVCETDQEKARVREVVGRIADNLIAHNFTLIDYDGEATRWGRFSPDELNRSEEWVVERGLNSLSALSYMAVAYHVTGQQKYRDAYLTLALDHGYAMNGATQSKYESGPGSFGQGDDNMAFVNYYHLVRFETDPKLQSMLYQAIYKHWQIEKYENNPFFNFVYAACCMGKVREDAFNTVDLSPPKPWLEESIDTLKRFPLDLTNWPMSNAHRTDMLPLPDHVRGVGDSEGTGYRVGGHVFPIDERPAVGLGDDVWALTSTGDGTTLREGVPFLLPYYLGLAHGYIAE